MVLTIKQRIKKYKESIHKLIADKIFGRKYIRQGSCKGCGRCCQTIYVRHSKHVIKEIEEFEKLKKQHFFYTYLKVVDSNETGLVFECTKLDKKTNKCTVHKNRPLICRQYPLEEIFMMGGIISDDCGYSFKPIKSFEEILNKIQKKSI